MRVMFEYTEDELLDTYRRVLKRSPTVGSIRRKDRVWFSILSGGLALLLFAWARGRLAGLIAGVLSGFIAALLHPAIYRRIANKRLRKLISESDCGTEPRICEVELTPAGVWSRHGKTQMIREWGAVEAIEQSEDGFEIMFKGCGLMVRNRAFKSENDKQEFLQLAISYHHAARAEGKT